MEQAKAADKFKYLASSNIDKDKEARGFAAKHKVSEGLVCVLQCVEPCWSFTLDSKKTNWPTVLDAWQQQVHPLHPGHLGKMPLAYNWTPHQSEWASDVAFTSRAELERWMPLWQRQALNYDSSEMLRFFGRARLVEGKAPPEIETEWKRFYGVNERYLEGMSAVKETRPVKELVEPLCARVPAPSKKATKKADKKPERKLRALNPWSKEDGALLVAISDPKWMVAGIRNRDLVAILYPTTTSDDQEKRRRSSRVTRLLRLLRHGLLQKVTKTPLPGK